MRLQLHAEHLQPRCREQCFKLRRAKLAALRLAIVEPRVCRADDALENQVMRGEVGDLEIRRAAFRNAAQRAGQRHFDEVE